MRVNGIHSQKELTEEGPAPLWRLHSLKVRMFWTHFKDWSVYKHKHCETCDARIWIRAFYVSSLTTYCQFLFHLILKSCTSLGSSVLWKLGSQRNVFSSNHGIAAPALNNQHHCRLPCVSCLGCCTRDKAEKTIMVSVLTKLTIGVGVRRPQLDWKTAVRDKNKMRLITRCCCSITSHVQLSYDPMDCCL